MGDLIDMVFGSAAVGRVAPAVVVSDLCRPALTTLITDEFDEDPADWLFDELDDALRVVESRVSAR